MNVLLYETLPPSKITNSMYKLWMVNIFVTHGNMKKFCLASF